MKRENSVQKMWNWPANSNTSCFYLFLVLLYRVCLYKVLQFYLSQHILLKGLYIHAISIVSQNYVQFVHLAKFLHSM